MGGTFKQSVLRNYTYSNLIHRHIKTFAKNEWNPPWSLHTIRIVFPFRKIVSLKVGITPTTHKTAISAIFKTFSSISNAYFYTGFEAFHKSQHI